MKTARKVLLLVLCAALLVSATVMGTLAYLTDDDSVTNTFTVGTVNLKLDEAPVDANGDATSSERVKANNYHLLPGHEYDKDPTVTVLEGSEECYVRMLVTINKQAELDEIFDELNEDQTTAITIQNVLTGWDTNKWIPAGEKEDGNTRIYEFRYHTTVAAPDADEELEPLFTKIEMPGAITKEQLATLYAEGANDNLKIDVVAHAIQADGFVANGTKTAADVAWEAFDNQN